MKKKYLTYHGTKRKNLESILKNGLFVSGGVYGKGVYTTSRIHKASEYGDVIIAIPLRTNESKFVTPLNKLGDWFISLENIPPSRLFYIVMEGDSDDFKFERWYDGKKKSFLVIKTPKVLNEEDWRYYLTTANSYICNHIRKNFPYEPRYNKISVTAPYSVKEKIGVLSDFLEKLQDLQIVYASYYKR